MTSCVTLTARQVKTCSLIDVREDWRLADRRSEAVRRQRERGRESGGGGRASAEELTVHPFFSAPTVFPRVERATGTSIRLQTSEDEVGRKNKKKKKKNKSKSRSWDSDWPILIPFKKKKGKTWRMHISPRSELDASLLSAETPRLFHPRPLLIFQWTRGRRSLWRNES